MRMSSLALLTILWHFIDQKQPLVAARAGFRILTRDVDAVSWLHFINQVVMSIDNGCVRRLTGWHVLRRLLNFDLLSNKIDKRIDVMTSSLIITQHIMRLGGVHCKQSAWWATPRPRWLSPSVCQKRLSGCEQAPGCGCCCSGDTQPARRCGRDPPPHGCCRRTPGTGRMPPASRGWAARCGSPCRWWWSADRCLCGGNTCSRQKL